MNIYKVIIIVSHLQ